MSDTKDTVQDAPKVDAPATAPAEATAPQAGADLSVQDLQGLKTIIDVASSRGAFKANEMAQVGAVYNKLDGFLNVAMEAQKETEEQ